MLQGYDKQIFLEELEDFLQEEGLSCRTVRIYLGRIRKLLDSRYSVGDLLGSIDSAIADYSCGGDCYDPRDSGNTHAALKKVNKLIRKRLLQSVGEFRLSYKSGWKPPVGDPYMSEYSIDGDTLTVTYSHRYKTITKPIATKHLRELIRLLDRAKMMGLLSPSDTAIPTVHGPAWSYGYIFGGACADNCESIFAGKPSAVLTLQTQFGELIEKILP